MSSSNARCLFHVLQQEWMAELLQQQSLIQLEQRLIPVWHILVADWANMNKITHKFHVISSRLALALHLKASQVTFRTAPFPAVRRCPSPSSGRTTGGGLSRAAWRGRLSTRAARTGFPWSVGPSRFCDWPYWWRTWWAPRLLSLHLWGAWTETSEGSEEPQAAHCSQNRVQITLGK